MLEAKQVAIYLGSKDRERLEKLTKLLTKPITKPNKSKVVQMALLFAYTRIDEFTKFTDNQNLIEAKGWLKATIADVKKSEKNKEVKK